MLVEIFVFTFEIFVTYSVSWVKEYKSTNELLNLYFKTGPFYILYMYFKCFNPFKVTGKLEEIKWSLLALPLDKSIRETV